MECAQLPPFSPLLLHTRPCPGMYEQHVRTGRTYTAKGAAACVSPAVRRLITEWPDIEAALSQTSSAYILGRGPSLPMALEAALKLKETSGHPCRSLFRRRSAPWSHGIGARRLPGSRAGARRCVARDHATTTVAALSEAGASGLRRPALDLPCAPAIPSSIRSRMIPTFYGAAERIARARGRDPDHPRLLKKVTKTR